MEYVRSQFNTLKERILEPRKFMQVLAGPRQVGKSTLVGQVLNQTDIAHALEVADAVDPEDSDWIHRVWEAARTTMMLRGLEEYLLVIDEVQKIDNWSEVVKREWDADTRDGVNLKVVLLGSSRLLLKKGLTGEASFGIRYRHALYLVIYPIRTVLPSNANPYLRIFSSGMPFAISDAAYCFSSICACAAATVSSSVCSPFFSFRTLNSMMIASFSSGFFGSNTMS